MVIFYVLMTSTERTILVTVSFDLVLRMAD